MTGKMLIVIYLYYLCNLDCCKYHYVESRQTLSLTIFSSLFLVKSCFIVFAKPLVALQYVIMEIMFGVELSVT